MTTDLTSTPTNSGDFCLSLDVEPMHYDVTIKTDLENSIFEGVVKIDLDVKNETSTIIFNSADLKLNNAALYSNQLKIKQYYTLTQFEPTTARCAFPCWDEPLLKATFAVSMISHPDTVNLSNMPITLEEIYQPQTTKVEDPSLEAL
ncbi:leukotriene A4 hydrolase N-terminal domain-containing protein [Suillus hirtellus]|nr:leukotriene A4 hydrolase N-terminal domain-containing protein [Suillus hirtellus]